MKSVPAFRALVVVSFCSAVFAPNLSAQIYDSSRQFTVVGQDSADTDSLGNTGVAVKALFEFDHELGYLRLTLTNLSGTLGYTNGVLMGVGFDGPSGINYIANSFTQVNVQFGEPGGVDYEMGNPGYTFTGGIDGSFDFGASTTGADGNGGGSPSDGLAGGYYASFQFRFDGDLSDFNADDFFDQNGTASDIGFRFQGVGRRGEDSDKIVYYVSDIENTPIPEPSTYGLIGAGLLLAMVARRRFQRR